MFWNTLFWWLFSESSLLTYIPTWDISFNWFSLQSSKVITSKINIDDFPDVEYNDYNIPKWHWKGLFSKYYRARKIRIEWIIKTDTKDNLDAYLDNFKKQLSVNSSIFKYKTQWVMRQTLATTTDLKFSREHYHINFIPFILNLTTTDSFFYWELNNTALGTSSASPFVVLANNSGSEISKPQIYITFNSASATNSVAVTINWITLTYSWTIATSDVLIIDCLNYTVSLNWVNKEYSWTFPELNTWDNNVSFTINGTFNVNVSIAYRNNYL